MKNSYYATSTLVLSMLLQGCGNTAPPNASFKDERLSIPAGTSTAADAEVMQAQAEFMKNFSALAQVGGENIMGAYDAAGILDSLIMTENLEKNLKADIGEEAFKKAKVDLKKLKSIRELPMGIVSKLLLSSVEEQLIVDLAKDQDAAATDEAIKATILKRLADITVCDDSDDVKDPTFSKVLKARTLDTESSALLHDLVLRQVRGEAFVKEAKNRVLVEVLDSDGKKAGALLSGTLIESESAPESAKDADDSDKKDDDKVKAIKKLDVQVVNYASEGALPITLDLKKDAKLYRIMNSDDVLRERLLKMYLKREVDKEGKLVIKDGKSVVIQDVLSRISKARKALKKLSAPVVTAPVVTQAVTPAAE